MSLTCIECGRTRSSICDACGCGGLLDIGVQSTLADLRGELTALRSALAAEKAAREKAEGERDQRYQNNVRADRARIAAVDAAEKSRDEALAKLGSMEKRAIEAEERVVELEKAVRERIPDLFEHHVRCQSIADPPGECDCYGKKNAQLCKLIEATP